MCADIVSAKLSKLLNVLDNTANEKNEINGDNDLKNPLTSQPIYSSSLITSNDIAAFNEIQETIGLEDFSKIILMKVAQKSMNDHAELSEMISKMDDSKVSRISEVAQIALGNSMEAAKSLMNYSLQKEKMLIEKQKLEIKSVTINNLNLENQSGMVGTQKEILDKIKDMMSSSVIDDDVPPLIS